MRFVLFAVVAGCNPIFGIGDTQLVDAPPIIGIEDAPAPPDRDRDGIPDPSDSCIVSIADAYVDWEGDGLDTGVDPCPYSYDDADADADGLCNEADGFPADTGDRKRCAMSFQNVRLNRELWIPRGDAMTWALLTAGMLSGAGTGALVAAESFEAPIATGFIAQVFPAPRIATTAPGVITLWLRTNDTATASDIGCSIRGDSSSSTLLVAGGTATDTVNLPPTSLQLIAAAVEPNVTGRANVRCYFRFTTTNKAVVDEVSFPPGRLGFGIDNIRVTFSTLVVTERDDAPAL